MSTDPTRDPRDAELASLLHAVDPVPALADDDWQTLRGRVAAQAELPLARLRRRRRVGPVWLRALVPTAAVAGLAAAVVAVNGGRTGEVPAALPPEEQQIVDQIVEASLPEDVDLLVSGEAAQAALLEAAVGS
jgi:hypothetical protein